MRAVVVAAPGAVALADVPAPAVEDPADAIVRVTTAAICGSDLHFLHGRAPVTAGDVMGHEAVGIVTAVGNAVTRVAEGDRVVLSFVNTCGACWWCTHGQHALCDRSRVFGAGAFGGHLAGTQAEAVRVPGADANLLLVPDAIDDERAVFLGDVLPTAVASAAMAAPAAGETVAVVGAGPVGLLTAQALLGAGADRVVVLDREPERLALAGSSGALAVDVRERDPEMTLAGLTEDRGADAVVEAVGSVDAFGTALDVVRRGGRVVVAGMYAGDVTELQLGVWWARALQVRFLGLCPVQAWWEAARDAMLTGTVDPAPLISHRLDLDEAPHGYDLFARRAATKVLLRP
ncbi:MAG TPA: alcohol dehydrogenase catalytic domain-containing protein [Actinomycetota bacterium]|nr:alcohol dehydrogenase catalytic domain-containing protein [Actinomycetota bacterium]